MLNKAGILGRNHSTYVSRWKETLRVNLAAAITERMPLIAKRLSGAGRPTALTAERELELRAWVMNLRRNGARVAVSERIVQVEAQRRWQIPATNSWVRGWMKRQGLAMRMRTTYKKLLTDRMVAVKQAYRNKSAVVFNTYRSTQIFNTDETSVYFDAPNNRTIDEVGAKSVEIGHTDHYADRVSIALCVNYAGQLMPPLVVHRCHEKVNLKKTGTFTKHYIKTDRGGDTVPGVEMWVTHKRKAWLDTELMCR